MVSRNFKCTKTVGSSCIKFGVRLEGIWGRLFDLGIPRELQHILGSKSAIVPHHRDLVLKFCRICYSKETMMLLVSSRYETNQYRISFPRYRRHP
jgi:hypothetical protein